jgi:hypothetical protein
MFERTSLGSPLVPFPLRLKLYVQFDGNSAQLMLDPLPSNSQKETIPGVLKGNSRDFLHVNQGLHGLPGGGVSQSGHLGHLGSFDAVQIHLRVGHARSDEVRAALIVG